MDDIDLDIQTSFSIWLIKNTLADSNNPKQQIPFLDLPPGFYLVPQNLSQPSSQGQVQSAPGCSYSDQSTAIRTRQKNMPNRQIGSLALEHEPGQR